MALLDTNLTVTFYLFFYELPNCLLALYELNLVRIWHSFSFPLEFVTSSPHPESCVQEFIVLWLFFFFAGENLPVPDKLVPGSISQRRVLCRYCTLSHGVSKGQSSNRSWLWNYASWVCTYSLERGEASRVSRPRPTTSNRSFYWL